MKKIFAGIALLSSSYSFADTVITFRDGVKTVPQEVLIRLSQNKYDVKKAWAKPQMTIQSLPRTPWERAMRHANLAVLVYGNNLHQDFSFPGVKSIEENIPFEDEELAGEPPFDPVKCDGIIYGIENFAATNQRLESTSSCDNIAIRPRGEFPYRITVSSPTKKTLEVYEHGDLIASGSGTLNVKFNYGYRQRYIVVRGEPGPYHLEFFSTEGGTQKVKLDTYVLSDVFSNVYGFGIPTAAPLRGSSTMQSEWVGAHMMGAESLWKDGFTGKGIKVAVVDTGVDVEHPFLKNAVTMGYDAFGKGTTPADYNDVLGHGSHVAGIIHQVAPDAEIMAVRVFRIDNTNGQGNTDDQVIADGIRWAIDNGAKVINLSLGGSNAPKGWQDVFKYGVSKGVLFACASGNERSYQPVFPARFAASIPGFGFSVGAANELMNMAVFSNWTGDDLNMKQVSSHGVRVSSAEAGGQGFVNMSGTSMATPQIAGYLALFRQAYPKASNVEIVEMISKYVQRPSVND